MSKQPIIITIANQKGGVGKTTCVINIAYFLAKNKKNVLIIDSDYQANASSMLLGDKIDSKKTLTYAIKHDSLARNVITPSTINGIDIIPTDQELDDLREQLIGKPNQFGLISHMINCESVKLYDYILIDTHPSLDCFFQSAISASDFFLIPLFPEADSTRGLAHQIGAVEKIKKYLNPKLSLIGCAIVKADKYSSTHKKFIKLIMEHGKENNINIFNSIIPQSQSVAASAARQLPLGLYKPNSPAAKAFKKLAAEIEKTALKLKSTGAKQIQTIDTVEVSIDL